jgi:hypothetical protein
LSSDRLTWQIVLDTDMDARAHAARKKSRRGTKADWLRMLIEDACEQSESES